MDVISVYGRKWEPITINEISYSDTELASDGDDEENIVLPLQSLLKKSFLPGELPS
jgi:hypothetical protein